MTNTDYFHLQLFMTIVVYKVSQNFGPVNDSMIARLNQKNGLAQTDTFKKLGFLTKKPHYSTCQANTIQDFSRYFPDISHSISTVIMQIFCERGEC